METRKGCSSIRRAKLRSGAKLILALLEKQPQHRRELCECCGIHQSTFYRILPRLIDAGYVKKTRRGYALSTYDEMDGRVEDAYMKLREKTPAPSVMALAEEVGTPPAKIEEQLYHLAKKYGLKIRETVPGVRLILPP